MIASAAAAPMLPRTMRTLRSYLVMLFGVTRWQLIGLLALTVLYSLTEGIGFALLLPTLQVAGLYLGGQGDADRHAALVSGMFVAVGLRPSLILLLGTV